MWILEELSMHNWSWLFEYNEKIDYKYQQYFQDSYSGGQLEENWDNAYIGYMFWQ